MLKGNVNRNTSDNKVDTRHRKCCESHWKKSGASLLLKLGKRKTLYFTSRCLCKKTSIYQVYATCASLLTGRGNRNHVGNIPRAPRAAPRVPRAHRLVGVPAALQVTRVLLTITRVSSITYHHPQRDHDLHVRLLPDRVGQAVRRQPHRLHSHQGHSRGKS